MIASILTSVSGFLGVKNKGAVIPPQNNTIPVPRRKGLTDKFSDEMRENYAAFLKDLAYICKCLENPRNTLQDLPKLSNLLGFIYDKYKNVLAGPFKDVYIFHINEVENKIAEMKIQRYKYFFEGSNKPVIIEAISRQAADYRIQTAIPEVESRGIKLGKLENVTVETLVEGVSQKISKGWVFVWSNEGWIPTGKKDGENE